MDMNLLPVLDAICEEGKDSLWEPEDDLKYHGLNIMHLAAMRVPVAKDQEYYDIISSIERVVHLFRSCGFVDYIPWMKYVPGMDSAVQLLGDASKTLTGIFSRKLDEALESNNEESFLTRIFGYQDSAQHLSRAEVYQMGTDMFLGGSETTSKTNGWILSYLVKYPSLQERISNEISEFMDSIDSEENEDGTQIFPLHELSKVPLLQAFIWEVLRCSFIAGIGLPHELQKDVEVESNGRTYNLPKGTTIFMDAKHIHTDPKVWPQGLNVDCDSWIRENGSFWSARRREIISFGLGKRACPGKLLAVKSVLETWGVLLYRYKFTLHDDFDIERRTDDGINGTPLENVKVEYRNHQKFNNERFEG
jgi:cytochrome P450 family 2 subfamily L